MNTPSKWKATEENDTFCASDFPQSKPLEALARLFTIERPCLLWGAEPTATSTDRAVLALEFRKKLGRGLLPLKAIFQRQVDRTRP
jgi:hypothetical protein